MAADSKVDRPNKGWPLFFVIWGSTAVPLLAWLVHDVTRAAAGERSLLDEIPNKVGNELGVVFLLVLIAVVGVYLSWVLIGIQGLTARLIVDTVGLQFSAWPKWAGSDLQISWDSIDAWSFKLVKRLEGEGDGEGAMSVEVIDRYLEITLNRSPGRITFEEGSAFFRDVEAELRAHVPTKERPARLESS